MPTYKVFDLMGVYGPGYVQARNPDEAILMRAGDINPKMTFNRICLLRAERVRAQDLEPLKDHE